MGHIEKFPTWKDCRYIGERAAVTISKERKEATFYGRT